MLEVNEMSAGEGSAPKRWQVPDVAYLSQAESLVLPRLLGRPEAPAEYGFYCFDSASGRLTQRSDRVARSGDGATVMTRPTPEAAPIRQQVDARGVLVRRTSEDGSEVEATTGEALLALWQRKGLPTQ